MAFPPTIKELAIQLRRQGHTYSEILSSLPVKVTKSTLSVWLNSTTLTAEQSEKIQQIVEKKIITSRGKALEVLRSRRQLRLNEIRNKVAHLSQSLYMSDTAEIALAMLYLGEGGKTRRSALMFGNSNPQIIQLFLKLLRHCYKIEEKQFRCTVQVRAGQNVNDLEKFWSSITKIPAEQFYKARIDNRAVNKPLRNPDYKGVCRIDYFSADIYNELRIIGDLLISGL